MSDPPMTQDDINNGRLVCVIGVALVKPAAFVIVRIQQVRQMLQATSVSARATVERASGSHRSSSERSASSP
jgi:phage tail sheath protein FI